MFPDRKFPSSSLTEKERRCCVMEELVSLKGSVLKVNGQLILLIPLEGGGSELVECARGISEVQGEYLKVVIPEWLAEILEIEEGDLISLHDTDGELHIQASNPRLVN
jgi:hypothetical protein